MRLIAIITIILINSVCFGQSKVGDATETNANFTINPKLHWIDDRWIEIDGGVAELGSVISERSFSPIPKSVFIDIDGLFSMDKICFQFKG